MKASGKSRKSPKREAEAKKLYRSRDKKIIAGVCGGYAEYFNTDPVWVRLLAIISILFGGISIIVYIASWILMPKNPSQKRSKNTLAEDVAHKIAKETKNASKEHKNSVILGVILIVLGAIFFFQSTFGWFSFRFTWPVILIVIGVYVVLRKH